ncbi:MAG: hypothetical protein WAK17_20405 [Candidatus Nitrosopolaris sp.]
MKLWDRYTTTVKTLTDVEIFTGYDKTVGYHTVTRELCEYCCDRLHNLVLDAKAEAEIMAHRKFLGECKHNVHLVY